MRLALFSTTSGQTDPETIHHGLITDAGVFDIAKRSDADLATLLVSPQARRTLAAVCHGTPDHAAADLCLLPPILPDAKIVCVGLNYHGHVHETGRDPNARPTLFLRLADSHVGHGEASSARRPRKSLTLRERSPSSSASLADTSRPPPRSTMSAATPATTMAASATGSAIPRSSRRAKISSPRDRSFP